MAASDFLLIFCLAIQALDVITTVIILKAGGREVWPPMAWLVGRVGVKPAVIVKYAVVLPALLVGAAMRPAWWAAFILALAAAATGYIFLRYNWPATRRLLGR